MSPRLAGLVAVLISLTATASASAITADGVGTMTVSPTYVIDGTNQNFLTFTFTAAGPMTNGEITLTVPAGWSQPITDGFSDGGTNGDCGSMVITGRTVDFTGVTLSTGGTCTVRYGLGSFFGKVTAPSTPGTSVFTTQQRSTSGGTLANIPSSPQVVVGEDGTGTMSVSPIAVLVGSAGNTLTFHYTAARTVASGQLAISVPVDWSTPSTTGTAAGYTTTTCPGGSVSVSSNLIRVTGMSLANGAGCDVVYGSKAASGPGAHAPSSGGTETFATQQESSNDNNLQTLNTDAPQVSVVAPDGSGTMTVTPTQVINGSNDNSMTFTYTAAAGGLANGEITMTVPAGWSQPITDGFSDGGTNGDCGSMVITGRTVDFTGVTLAAGATCTVRYGLGSFFGKVTAPSTATTSTFTTQERSSSIGALTSLATSPQVQVGQDGTGSMTVAPTSALVSSSGNTLTFTYTAARDMSAGALSIAVPAGWSSPSTTANAAGSTTTTCSGGSVSIVSGTTIQVTGVNLANGATCTVVYGSKASGGPGASTPSSGGTSTFTAKQESASAGTLTALATGSPQVFVVAPDGTGTMTVSPTRVITGSSGNAMTFTYTAPTGGLSNGEITLTVPAGWSQPITDGFSEGGSNGDCGSMVITGRTLDFTGVTLSAGSTCSIRFGLGSSFGTVTAPSTGGTSTFAAKERSSSIGTLTSLASSPQVAVGADGVGTMTVAPTTALVSSSGNTLVFTYTSTGALTNGALTLAVPTGWSAPSTTSGTAGYTTINCTGGTVGISGSTIQVTGINIGGSSSCTITYGSRASSSPGATSPSSGGASTFTAQEKSDSSGTLATLSSSPVVNVVSADGTGTMTVSPAVAIPGSTGNALAFTYTAATGGLSNGEITIAVPAGWTPPATGFTAGSTGAGCGTVSITGGDTIHVTGVTLADGATCVISYGSVMFGPVTAPSSAGVSTFTAQERSTAGGTLTSLASVPQVTVGADGSGTMTASPVSASASSTGNTLTFTYTGVGGLTNGQLNLTVPAGWSAPSVTGADPGFTTSTCAGTVSLSGRTIQVTSVTVANAATCTIVYGDTGSGGPGATAPSSTGAASFPAEARALPSGTLTALTAGSPQETVYAADGTGTMTAAPGIVGYGSSGDTIVFTYTAPAGGLSSGAIEVAVPAGWTAPSTTGTNAGYTTSTCGSVSASGGTIHVGGVSLAGAATCVITYGSKASGGAGATAPSASATSTFAALEKSTGTGALTALGTAPTVSTTAADGSGTMTVSPLVAIPGSTGNALDFTYTAATGGLSNGEITIAVPAGWTAPTTAAATPGLSSAGCGTVSITGGDTIHVTAVTLAGGATCVISYGSALGPVTAPSSAGISTFTASERSTLGGILTSVASAPQVAVGEDGSGTMTVSPPAASASSTGNTLTFTYTAPASGLSGGALDVAVPAGWTPPSTTGTDAGYTTSTCGGVAISGGSIHVTGVSLAGAGTCAVTYGSKASGGAGGSAPPVPGVSTFATLERSTAAGTLAALGSSPTVSVASADGSGTLALSPSSVTTSSTGHTFVLTYTAAAGGLANGEIDVAVPAGLPAPSTTATDAGFTTSTCGALAIPATAVQASGVTLAGGDSCTITYGSAASGGPGITAPAAAAILAFATQQKSTAVGTLTNLASAPQLTVAAPPTTGGTGSGSGGTSGTSGTANSSRSNLLIVSGLEGSFNADGSAVGGLGILSGADGVSWPAGAFPGSAQVTIKSVLAGTPAATLAAGGFSVGGMLLQLTVTGPSGAPITSFAQPLKLRFARTDGTVPAYYDGTRWHLIPRLSAPALPAGQPDGYFVNPNGSIDVYTRHATLFAVAKDGRAPTAPRRLRSRVKAHRLVLSWAASKDNSGVVIYRVRRNGRAIEATRGRSASVALRAGRYTVVAYDLAGNRSRAAALNVSA